MPITSRPGCREDFKVAIICALPQEPDAVSLLFDEFWDEDGDPYGRAPGDTNTYTTGRIGKHNVVLVVLPNMGNNGAATATASVRSSYRCLKLALLVGICGGVPNRARLWYPESFVHKNTVEDIFGRASKDIRALIARFETELGRERQEEKTAKYLQHLQSNAKRRRPRAKYQYAGPGEEKLFAPDYTHQHREACDASASEQTGFCEAAAHASRVDLGCDESRLIARVRLQSEEGLDRDGVPSPRTFMGCVASGDPVMKSGEHCDRIAAAHSVIAFEMEGAGASDKLPCVVIKGGCDYADSHKNKNWQDFMAATAASVAKAMLERYILEDIAEPGQGAAAGNREAGKKGEAKVAGRFQTTRLEINPRSRKVISVGT
ncbi:hypothetical protein CCHL11_08980 [Colletotrichum chlorophyti]|uniref:Nucleoside phosphorylase domain-containing protein n=1 Tax=Colletotrichum chlorophyti TaxID=708187 RepID=A0A1Q8RWV7_9PEZI|nr:hypothetical protein CCHL11_08980 [Colletotrichum chlorophyti]